MNFIFVLCISHLSLALGAFDLFSVHPYLCQAIAFIQHYVWLVSFSWMALISFDIFFSLSAVFHILNSERMKCMFTMYACISWIIPLIPCSVCLSLTIYNVGSVRYDINQKCWLANPKSVLIMFAGPLIAVLLFNISMFIGSFLRLKQLAKNLDTPVTIVNTKTNIKRS